MDKIIAMLQAQDDGKEGSSLLELNAEDVWISGGDKVDEDIFERFDENTENRIVERESGLQPNPPKGHHLHKTRSCKTFQEIGFKPEGRVAVVKGDTFEACLQSCEENLACSQIVFDKAEKTCVGRGKASDKALSGKNYEPVNFVSANCWSEAEEAVSLIEKSGVDADAEFEEKMKLEEQLAKEEDATPPAPESAKFWQDKKKAIVQKAPVVLGAKNSLKLKQKVKKMKKCTTFETKNLVKKGSLLQMGKKLLQSTAAGDFLTCLQLCQQDAACKQVVYDKQASQCYKHDTVMLKKTNDKNTKYIAATCL